ncbi:MAG: hypothetical protein AAFZ52_13770, partial [Bacteroidota bacterium]
MKGLLCFLSCFFFAVVLPAQGFERLLRLEEHGTIGGVELLDDQSFYFSVEDGVGRRDERGNLLWLRRTGNYGPVIRRWGDSLRSATAISIISPEIALRQNFNFSGNASAGRRMVATTLPDSFVRGSLSMKITDNGGLSALSYRRGENSSSLTDWTLTRLNAEGQLVHQFELEFGRLDGLNNSQSIHLVEDSSYVYAGRVFDAVNESGDSLGTVYGLVHFYPDGSFRYLAPPEDYISDYFATAVYDGHQLVHIKQDAGSQKETLFFDLRSDSLVGRKVFTTPPRLNRYTHLVPLADGGLLTARRQITSTDGVSSQFVHLTRYSADLEVVFTRRLGFPGEILRTRGLAELPDGRLHFVGLVDRFMVTKLLYLVSMDASGVTFPNQVEGRLIVGDDSCQDTGTDQLLTNWWLRAEPLTPGKDTLYTFTNADGTFQMAIDTGEYLLRPIPINAYWKACPPQAFTVAGTMDTIRLNPTVRAEHDCALLTVAIASGHPADPCTETDYRLSYENRGTQPSEPSLLRVVLDSFYVPFQSVPTWDERIGDTLFYNLPAVPVGASGRIVVEGRFRCEEAIPGQTHCTEVHVFPDSLCTPPNLNWDGSSLEVEGECLVDSVRFRLRNNSPFDMGQPRRYVIFEDVVLHLGGDVQLPAFGEEIITLPATGKTYHLQAEQSSGHPLTTTVAATIEACGEVAPGEYSLGIFGQYPRDDGNPFRSEDCRTNLIAVPDGIREYGERPKDGMGDSPVQLFVSPRGLGADHLIDKGTTLTFLVGFENTRLDTLPRIVFRDTLPPGLDLTGLRPGPAFAPYDFSVSPYGVVEFAFREVNIL